MSHLLKKKGVWLFLATVVLFFAGQTYLGLRMSGHVRATQSIEKFDVQGIHAIRFERSVDPDQRLTLYRLLDIKFVDSATQVSAAFDANIDTLQSRVEGGVLILTFIATKEDVHQKRRWGYSSGGEKIRLPSSIQSLELTGAGMFGVSSEEATSLARLNVRILDCSINANFDDMTVEALAVTKNCQQPRSKTEYPQGSSIGMGDVKAGDLEITSTDGNINFKEDAQVGNLKLNLRDGVRVQAAAALLRKARFGAAPE